MKLLLLFVLVPAIILSNSSLFAQENKVAFSASDPAPILKSESGGFQYNIRGRIMVDWSTGNDNIITNDFSGTKLRAARLGIEGQALKSMNFRLDVDLGQDKASVKDAYIQFKRNSWVMTVGQSKIPNSLEWNTAISQTTFMEKAAFRSAFGFGRGMGVKVSTASNNWSMSAGFFQGNNNFSGATKEGYIAAARGTYGGNINNGKWMVGLSARYKNKKDTGPIRYKAKSITNLSMIMSDYKSKATKEILFAAEVAITVGSFFATAEHAFVNAIDAITLRENVKLYGGYAEVGYILTGERRPLNIKVGSWGRHLVSNPVGKGGNGLWQISARYDKLDLTNNGAFGGEQSSYILSLSWYLSSYLRTMLDYGHTKVKNRFTMGTSNSANVVGLRLNVDW